MVSLLRFRHFDERLVSENGAQEPAQRGSVNPAVLGLSEDVDDLTGDILTAKAKLQENLPSIWSKDEFEDDHDIDPEALTTSTSPEPVRPSSSPVVSVSAIPNPPNGILQAANYVMDVGRSMTSPRFPNQSSSQRRDQLGQPLLNASASQASIPVASANDGATPDDGDLGDGHQDPSRPSKCAMQLTCAF